MTRVTAARALPIPTGHGRAKLRRCPSRSTSERPVGALGRRCVERCWATTAHARRLENPTAPRAAQRLSGRRPVPPFARRHFLEHRLVQFRLRQQSGHVRPIGRCASSATGGRQVIIEAPRASHKTSQALLGRRHFPNECHQDTAAFD